MPLEWLAENHSWERLLIDKGRTDMREYARSPVLPTIPSRMSGSTHV